MSSFVYPAKLARERDDGTYQDLTSMSKREKDFHALEVGADALGGWRGHPRGSGLGDNNNIESVPTMMD